MARSAMARSAMAQWVETLRRSVCTTGWAMGRSENAIGNGAIARWDFWEGIGWIMAIPFVLASASPARRRLLQLAGIDPFVFPSAFDEDSIQLRDPAALVQELAIQKLRSSLQELWQQRGSAPGGFFSATPGVMLGCDSVLALQGEIYGKPENAADAIARWQQMRGQVGELFTGHALSNGYTTPAGELKPSQEIVRCQVTRVFFAAVSDRQIEAYVATGEPLHCAGCFALEGKGSVFVEKIEGCHTNVIGLSMPLLRQMLAEMNCDVTDFWRKAEAIAS